MPTSQQPFRFFGLALDAFPIELWTRVATRRLRRATRALLGSGDVAGYRPLREAIAACLGASRGVRCTADQVVIVSGSHQALDLLARVLVKPGDPVWMEDPGSASAAAAFATPALGSSQYRSTSTRRAHADATAAADSTSTPMTLALTLFVAR